MHDHLLTIAGFYALAVFLPLSVILLYVQPGLWHNLFISFLGMLTGYLDVNSHEVQFTVLLLLVFGFFSGFSDSKRSWICALLLAVWVPLFAFLRILVERSYGAIVPEGFGSFLAFLPAFAGVYLGVGVRTASKRNAR